MSLSFWLRDYLYIPLGGSRLRNVSPLPEPDDHDVARRPLAWRQLGICSLGRTAWRRPCDQPRYSTSPKPLLREAFSP
ncbi:MAG: hypothetical protein IPL91_02045 [Hyphomicrobium sp.]|nr:hypothetical protein [Hyphomicrobium sp.]